MDIQFRSEIWFLDTVFIKYEPIQKCYLKIDGSICYFHPNPKGCTGIYFLIPVMLGKKSQMQFTGCKWEFSNR